MQVEQQQQVVVRKQEQAMAAREALQQLRANPEPTQQIAYLILQQNQPLYLARVLQVTHTCRFVWHNGTGRTPSAAQIHARCVQQRQACKGKQCRYHSAERSRMCRTAVMPLSHTQDST